MSINAQEIILTLKLLIMLKKILNLDGAKELNKKELVMVSGGKIVCQVHDDCPTNQCCGYESNYCFPIDNNEGLCDGRDEAFYPSLDPLP